jgi:hypothetical protein
MHPKIGKPTAIFFIIGILLMVCSLLVRLRANFSWVEYFSALLNDFSFVLLTVVILDFFWNILGGDPLVEQLKKIEGSLTLLQDSSKAGLIRIFYASGGFSSHQDWMERLLKVNKSLDLMGYTLFVWGRGEGFQQKIIDLVKRGVVVRILIMDPNNPFYNAIINDAIPGNTEAATRGESSGAINLFENLRAQITSIHGNEKLGSFEFRLVKKGIVLCQICRTDNCLTAISYLYSENASRTPLIEAEQKETGLFDIYQTEFDRLWASNP